jgi:putative membrane protein insertion efficiency factor
MLSRILIALVLLYRWGLSPVMGQNCRFYPSCSQYALDALRHHGAFRACWLTLRRLLRCHPWHPGGYDPVPGCNHHDSAPPSTSQVTPSHVR